MEAVLSKFTGIGTYLWVLTNKKEEKRKGKVQLIDATSMKSTLRKNLGDKNCEMTEPLRRKVMELYLAFEDADPEYSKVFQNEEFGFYQVDVNRPLRLKGIIDEEHLAIFKDEGKDDEMHDFLRNYAVSKKASMNYNSFASDVEESAKSAGLKWPAKRANALKKYFADIDEKAEAVLDKKGNPEFNSDLKESEQVPLLYEGGIKAFFENEIAPYVNDAVVDSKNAVIGYELSFTKYFYKPVELRSVEDIVADIRAIEESTDGLLASIIGGEV